MKVESRASIECGGLPPLLLSEPASAPPRTMRLHGAIHQMREFSKRWQGLIRRIRLSHTATECRPTDRGSLGSLGVLKIPFSDRPLPPQTWLEKP
jgi:hypothetical protein